MRKLRPALLMLAAVMMLAITAPAPAETGTINTLKVNGQATVTLAADTATIYIGVTTRQKTAVAAQQDNALIMDDVIAAIAAAGVKEEDIVTSSYNVQTYTDGYSPAFDSGTTTTQYEVYNMLQVTIRDLSAISKIIDTATQTGANNIYGLEFTNSKGEEAYQEALTLAVESAAKSAGTLAAATGRELGNVVGVEETGYYYGPFGGQPMMDMAYSGRSTPIVSGAVSVSASVIVEYELRMQPLVS